MGNEIEKQKFWQSNSANFSINLYGALFYFISAWCFLLVDGLIDTEDFLGIMFISATPQLLYQCYKVKVFKKIISTKQLRFDSSRYFVKMVGLLAVIALIGFLYWVFPEYQKDFYLAYWSFLIGVFANIFLIAPVYIFLTDALSEEPEDGLWNFGNFVLGRFKKVNKHSLFLFVRIWIVKAFFLPLMCLYFMSVSNQLLDNILHLYHAHSVESFYKPVLYFIFSMDLLYGTLGYFMTFRLFNTHVESADPSMLGWVVCLMCYQPFWIDLFGPSYLGSHDDPKWLEFLSGHPYLMYIWCVCTLGLFLIYALSTVSFGVLFSNLTYRGLICNGSYRFTKHPAYLTKNIGWWFIAVPFLGDDAGTIIRNCVMLLGVNYIYYMRARTEENHLSNYPEYVAYANWMNDNGLLAPIGKKFKFLQYSYERACLSKSSLHKSTIRREMTDFAK
jgi:hypothetical protein